MRAPSFRASPQRHVVMVPTTMAPAMTPAPVLASARVPVPAIPPLDGTWSSGRAWGAASNLRRCCGAFWASGSPPASWIGWSRPCGSRGRPSPSRARGRPPEFPASHPRTGGGNIEVYRMRREIIVNSSLVETRVAVIEDGTLVELLIDNTHTQSLAGNIYNGRVLKILPGMQAAFVDIGLARDAFLYVRDIYEDMEIYENLLALEEEDIPEEPVDVDVPPRPAGR